MARPPLRRWQLLAAFTLVVWCVSMLVVRRTDAITDDWQGWRQADTQAIARNFAFEELAPLHPRIDWRGDGPGYVETELQLYPTIIALVLHAGGESVLPGQLLSLGCTALAAAVLFSALARRFDGLAAYLALLGILGHQGMIAISTSIQPDALGLLAFTIGFTAFVRYLELETSEEPRRSLLATAMIATAVAALVKPTMLELGIVQFVLVLLASRGATPKFRPLRDRRIWIGWMIVLAVVVAYLFYARSLYVRYGNTFGILSGGDSKLPTASMLPSPALWLALARYGTMWGLGLPAIPAALYLAWRRRVGPELGALAAGALALSVLAFRYTTDRFGTHYHLPHVVLGAWLVAAAAADLTPRLRSRLGERVAPIMVSTIGIAAVLLGARSVRFLRRLPVEPETTLGARLATIAPPGTLVAVRARAEAYNVEWHTTNNFEDPRIFYLSRTRGWVLPNDLSGASRLADVAARGALYYVHVRQKPIDAELAEWLARHAKLIERTPEAEIHRIVP
jgi:hypothetical protein